MAFRRCCKTSQLASYLVLILYLVSSVSLTECAKQTFTFTDRIYFVRYINSSMGIILLILPLYSKCTQFIHERRSKNLSELELYRTQPPSPRNHSPTSSSSDSLSIDTKSGLILQGNMCHFMLWTVITTIFQTGAGLIYYLALTGVSVPTAQSLLKLKALWVYILSVIFLKESVSSWKCLGVVISFGGILCYVLPTTDDDSDHNTTSTTSDTWWGCLLLLSAAMMWSVRDIWTNIAFQRYYPSSKYYGSFLWEGLIGAFTIILFWWTLFLQPPIGSLVDEGSTQIETMWKWIVITGLVLSVTNASFYTLLNMTSPVFINYGAFFTVPLAFLLDVIIHGYTLTLYPVMGALCIMSGFVMLEIIEEPRWFKYSVDDRIRRWMERVRMWRRDEEAENVKFMEQIDDKIEMIEIDENSNGQIRID